MKLFKVEFGSEKESGHYLGLCFTPKVLSDVHVVAETFNEAVGKALRYAEKKLEKATIVNEVGDIEPPSEISIAAIYVICADVEI